jgi:hypothetical protein
VDPRNKGEREVIDGDVKKLPRLVKFLIDVLQYAVLAGALFMMMKYPPP